jgi:hypothetical protein
VASNPQFLQVFLHVVAPASVLTAHWLVAGQQPGVAAAAAAACEGKHALLLATAALEVPCAHVLAPAVAHHGSQRADGAAAAGTVYPSLLQKYTPFSQKPALVLLPAQSTLPAGLAPPAGQGSAQTPAPHTPSPPSVSPPIACGSLTPRTLGRFPG